MINENSQELFERSLINSTDDSERTVIHWACSGGRTNIVAWLLNEGVQTDICDSRYVNDHIKNMYVILEISFLSHLFFLTSRWTPLIIASSAGHEDIVHLLLGAGM